MTREDYEEHKEDYEDHNVSDGAFVLFQSVYIKTLEEQLKAKDEEIEKLKKLVNDFNNTYSVGDFDFESYYAMLKEN